MVHGLALRHTDQLMRTWNETWHAAGPKLRGCWDFANFAADQFHELARDLVVEMLDKNSGELSFTCPRIWALCTQQSFGYHLRDSLLPGLLDTNHEKFTFVDTKGFRIVVQIGACFCITVISICTASITCKHGYLAPEDGPATQFLLDALEGYFDFAYQASTGLPSERKLFACLLASSCLIHQMWFLTLLHICLQFCKLKVFETICSQKL